MRTKELVVTKPRGETRGGRARVDRASEAEAAVRKAQAVTDRELDILKILWTKGKASVRDVQKELSDSIGPVAYSTVQTLLNIMEEKKSLVGHAVEGRTFIYFPKKSPDRTIRDMTKRFVDRVFDGALDRVMVALLDARTPNSDELAQLRAMIDEAERRSGDPDSLAIASDAGRVDPEDEIEFEPDINPHFED